MNTAVGTQTVSMASISKALSLLLEDFRVRNQDGQIDDYTLTAYKRLGKQASELESVLSAFQHHVRHAIADIRRQQNALVPVHRLPAELLGYVFLFHTPEEYGPCADISVIHEENGEDHSEDQDLRPDKVYSMAVKLASVSSNWHHTAVSTAQLWSYMGSRNNLRVTKIQLERSKESPLFISCSASASKQHEQKFLDLVVPQIYRWKSFDAFTRLAASLSNYDLRGFTAPLLEHFIVHRSAIASEFSKLPPIVLEGAPRLRGLHISDLSYPLGSNIVSGLTHLSVKTTLGNRGFTMREFELLFSSSPMLETLCLCGANIPYQGLPNPLSPVKLSYLRFMQFFYLDPRVTIALLLSLFPEHGLHPVTKIIGSWILQPQEMIRLLQSAQAGSLWDLYTHSITWLEVAGTVDGAGVHIGVGMESVGGQLPLLEIDTSVSMEGAEEMVANLLCPDGTSLLRSVVLKIRPAFAVGTLLGSRLRMCPHFERLVIDTSYDKRFQSFLPLIVSLCLSHLDDRTVSPLLSNSHLKLLSFKPLQDLQPVVELFKTLYGPSRDVPITTGLLEVLERLEIRCIRHSRAETRKEAIQELESLLDARNIQLHMVPIDDQR